MNEKLACRIFVPLLDNLGMRGVFLGVVACMVRVAAAAPVRHPNDCVNEHRDDECDMWARNGECDKNKAFMKRSCARSCKSCGWEDDYCSDRVNDPPALTGVGSITKTFERAGRMAEFGPRTWSSPHSDPPGPWVMTFENFIREEEIEAFISTTDAHFSRSLAGDVVSPVRTSQQAWCQVAPCVDNPLVNRVHDRAVNLTGVPKPNAEFFQVLRYEPGQFYKTHHDQNADPDSLMGVRLFTFFIYLRSPVSGGATHFPRLNITVQPQAGRALMWPNVMDEDLRKPDMRTEHEALPPMEGLKFSANLWLHMYDFRGPNTHGCDMAKRVRKRTTAVPSRLRQRLDAQHKERGLEDNEEDEEDEEEAKIEL